MSPSPPKVLSPKRSRLLTASSHEFIRIRASQSDSSISSSDKAADLKPQVSKAWLDEANAASEDTGAKSQSPKRPYSSPTPSLHKRSSGGLSSLPSFEEVSTEKDKVVPWAIFYYFKSWYFKNSVREMLWIYFLFLSKMNFCSIFLIWEQHSLQSISLIYAFISTFFSYINLGNETDFKYASSVE